MGISHFDVDQPSELRIRRTTHLGSNTRHTSSAEAIEHNVPRLGIMQNVPHNCLVRNFRVIAMSIVNRVFLPLTHVRSKRLAMIVVRCFVVGRAVLADEILNEGIRAGGVIRRTGKRNDVLVLADGKAFDMAHLVNICLGQLAFFHGVCPPCCCCLTLRLSAVMIDTNR